MPLPRSWMLGCSFEIQILRYIEAETIDPDRIPGEPYAPIPPTKYTQDELRPTYRCPQSRNREDATIHKASAQAQVKVLHGWIRTRSSECLENRSTSTFQDIVPQPISPPRAPSETEFKAGEEQKRRCQLQNSPPHFPWPLLQATSRWTT